MIVVWLTFIIFTSIADILFLVDQLILGYQKCKEGIIYVVEKKDRIKKHSFAKAWHIGNFVFNAEVIITT